MGDDAPRSVTETEADFAGIQHSERFRELKKRHRSFVFPVLAAALVWYFAYVLLAGYAPEFMSTPVFGSINIGLLIGLGQVVTTFAITMIYVAYANRKLDPLAEELRDEAAREGVR